MTTKKIATFGLLTAMALVLSYIDRIVSLDFIAPGIRLGLGNTVLLYGLYVMRKRDALLLMVLKVGLSSLLFGFSQFPYSFSGGILSLAAMIIAYQLRMNVVTVSVIGGVMHNVGQILMAAAMTTPALIVTYLPVLMVFGVIMGVATGFVAKYVLRALSHTDKDIKQRLRSTDILSDKE